MDSIQNAAEQKADINSEDVQAGDHIDVTTVKEECVNHPTQPVLDQKWVSQDDSSIVIVGNETDDNRAHTMASTSFANIQTQLKTTLEYLQQHKFAHGLQILMDTTDTVVEQCERLGLTTDDHSNQEHFWAGLNNCWLYALAQKLEPVAAEEQISRQECFDLKVKIVGWADKLERYGLVNYDLGWWETDILAALASFQAKNSCVWPS
ncbi:hypothetical protein DM01DRAFT_1337352 [Hesseltinella vesiculosa]|uniref:Uncharacterized protein n=1 Tax=Hesseltinella vesiculosa TaxID=101127 RepID=A0A1X2GEM6_9FUNG|nr:hypothetical protein DM01DRAFT_1337352 [Hesseltinella vesiculosa]